MSDEMIHEKGDVKELFVCNYYARSKCLLIDNQ